MAQSEDLSNGQLPLQGVVLCCTSLTQDVRTKLTDAALQMGATHKLDLTADVTHLIVGSISTPKYRYVAKDRPDIKVLKPSWMDAVREAWMEGGDVDVEEFEEKHRFPPFTGLHICVTGFDNIEQRNRISYTAEAQGATYHGDLTKVVSHLIARKPEGQKYNAAKQWGLHVVSLEWFEDSLLRGLALDEKLYDPTMPIEEQGIGAFRRYSDARKTLGKHARESEAQDAGRKKLRRTASSRLQSQSQDMWQDISVRSFSPRPSDVDQWRDQDDGSSVHVSKTTSGIQNKQSSASENIARPGADTHESPVGLFAGSYVLIHGFDQAKFDRLQQFLEPNGACVVRTLSELEDASCNPLFQHRYLLVPHAESPQLSPLPEVPAGTITATEWWVERCIHYKRTLDPTTDVLSRPLTNVTITGFQHLLVSTTGFAGVDLRQVAEAVRLLGATYQEKIVPSSSVLISGSTSIKKEKAFYAQKHNIPVVSADWLWACIESNERLPFDKFTVSLPLLDAKDFPVDPSTSSPAPSDVQNESSKDPGKAKDPSALKRLSNTRNKHATPSLSLQASKPKLAVVMPKPRPILHEDEDESTSLDSDLLAAPTEGQLSRNSPQPLQEVSPNFSPRKTSETPKDANDDLSSKIDERPQVTSRTVSPTKPASPPKSPEKANSATDDASAQQFLQQNLNADLVELINITANSRPTSASGRSPEKRKKRPLGRAPSGISNRSNSSNLSPALPNEVPESLESDAFDGAKDVPAPPSTQLGYETPEAEAHRLQMSKKMGTKLQDDHGMKRLASVGTVKDSTASGDAGVGGRVRAKQRSKW